MVAKVEEAEHCCRADITAGPLKLPESRVIANLLLNQIDTEGWKDAIVTKNVIQARNPATAKRLAETHPRTAGDAQIRIVERSIRLKPNFAGIVGASLPQRKTEAKLKSPIDPVQDFCANTNDQFRKSQSCRHQANSRRDHLTVQIGS
jgi:hypothetical protein